MPRARNFAPDLEHKYIKLLSILVETRYISFEMFKEQ